MIGPEGLKGVQVVHESGGNALAQEPTMTYAAFSPARDCTLRADTLNVPDFISASARLNLKRDFRVLSSRKAMVCSRN